ncbi:MAG: M20/M25/M40 family metallo-hydrolase [Acidobacteriota bacterium]|nr:M20/M25/M40 family metallo-hydrolase [Acidobacteriota bacterium]
MAQTSGRASITDTFLTTPAVSGYEQELAKRIRETLKDWSPKTDNLGNVYVTIGSGAPHRVIVTPMDEPGYVVSEITADGYLRVQRLPQRAPNSVFDLLHAAQPVWVVSRDGKKIAGVFTGLSVHLQPGRQNAPMMAHPDEMYVDIGAANAEEVRAAGVDLLDPISLARDAQKLGADELASPAIGDRIGCVVLAELLQSLKGHPGKLPGTLTVAFAAQQWTGGRGLDRLLNEFHPDEMIYVGRFLPPRNDDTKTSAPPAHEPAKLGSGILVGTADAAAPLSGLAAEIKKIGDAQHIAVTPVSTAAPAMASYAKPTPLPARFAHLGVASLYPVTPAETIRSKDVSQLGAVLYQYAAGEAAYGGVGSGGMWACGDCGPPLIGLLTETYGASGHEAKVREQVKKLLPSWAKPETDAAGNLVLKMGTAAKNSAAPKIVFVAHMDEIGYQVRSIEPDGRLLVDVLGGGFTEYFLGHVVLVQKSDGSAVGGVLELPADWDQPKFEWPRGPKAMDEAVHLYVGTHSAEETRKLGIKVGDWATVPKRYRPLIGTRANARSFDDRVGCAALIEAVKALGQDLGDRQVTFVWSTEEEVGLNGAAAFAERAAKEGTSPDFVFAIDTFVSSDSPIESKRFADAEIGKGFVIRAVDNSNIAPHQFVDRVVQLARENKIPVQYGVTGGGNDGAVFVRYGTVDVPLSWPLRYSHSPGEVIDTRDLDALSKIVAVLAKKW